MMVDHTMVTTPPPLIIGVHSRPNSLEATLVWQGWPCLERKGLLVTYTGSIVCGFTRNNGEGDNCTKHVQPDPSSRSKGAGLARLKLSIKGTPNSMSASGNTSVNCLYTISYVNYTCSMVLFTIFNRQQLCYIRRKWLGSS